MPVLYENTLAIIPARGGSKGIPRKNIKELSGKPLIAWSIEAALEADATKRVVVATDDSEIAQIAKKHGAEVPFLLPSELTQDDSSILDVIKYVLEWFKKEMGEDYSQVLFLEPTSPLRTPQHIKESIDLFNNKDADSVVSVMRVPGHFSPHWQFVLDNDSALSIFTNENIRNIIPRRQQLPATYTRDGAIYLFKSNLLFNETPGIYGERVFAYVIDPKYTVDIDEPSDWDIAEKKMEKRNKG